MQLISSNKTGDVIFSGIARKVKAVIFDDDLKKLEEVQVAGNSKVFYYILAGIVLVIGGLVAAIGYSRLADWKIAAVIFLMFVVVALLALKNVLFPTKFNTCNLKALDSFPLDSFFRELLNVLHLNVSSIPIVF